MKFGPLAVAHSLGAVVAHAVRGDGLVLRKGEIIGTAQQAAMQAAGITTLIAAQLEPGDIGENEAAKRLSAHLAGAHLRCERPFTGRVNLFAKEAGLLIVDALAIAGVNAVDEAITAATLAPFRALAPGDMAATIKIIPFAITGEAMERALRCPAGCIAIAPFRALRIGVASTLLPGLKSSTVNKTLRILQTRLDRAGARIVREKRCAHDDEALSQALGAMAPHCDALIVFGASAITDRRDVIPAALLRAGGRIEHFGMPVDPGNLLLLGDLKGLPVIGAPGCARSPKENGFDWVLQRILAGVPISGADIKAMGVGGLLMEIATRPQPRLGDV